MGLIQTPDQLKFSYLAIVEGAKGLGLVRGEIRNFISIFVDLFSLFFKQYILLFQISKEILSELVRPPTRPLLPSDSSSSSDSDLDDDDVDLGIFRKLSNIIYFFFNLGTSQLKFFSQFEVPAPTTLHTRKSTTYFDQISSNRTSLINKKVRFGENRPK